MGTDTRYLVVTLVAVFVALTIGVLVGVGITNQPSLEKLSQQFKKEFEKARKENQAVQADHDRIESAYRDAQKLIKNVLPSLVQGKLKDQRIAVFCTTEHKDVGFLEELETTLKEAGGKIISVTTFKSGFSVMKAGELFAFQNALSLEALASDILPEKVAANAAGKIVTGKASAALGSLKKIGLMEFSGDYTIPAHKVILVGGLESPSNSTKKPTNGPRVDVRSSESIDTPVIEALKSLKIPTVGVETSDVPDSYMDVYQRLDLSTVDNVDTYAGQVSLVYALAGKAGNYGTKNSADRLLPNLEIPSVSR